MPYFYFIFRGEEDMYKMIISNYEEKEKVSASFVWVLLMLRIINVIKVNDTGTRKRFEICSKLTIKTPELHQ